MVKESRGRGSARWQVVDGAIETRDQSGIDECVRDLSLGYRVEEEPRVKESEIFFDTFDSRLFSKGLGCSRVGARVRLFSIETQDTEASGNVDPFPRFATDFPTSDLRDRLLPVVKHRALVEVLRTATDRRSWRVLNSDQKTVARLVRERVETCDATQSLYLGAFLSFKPVRGYEKVAEEMQRWSDDRRLQRLEGGSVYLLALEALHRTPTGRAAESRGCPEASVPAADAVRGMLQSFYETVCVNQPGVLADTDIEFLHDYRVAIRKARSLVGQTRGVFAPGPTAQLRRMLSWLGRSTNALRDLDVYLLHRPKYHGWLAAPLGEAVDPFFVALRSARRKAYEDIVFAMNSEEYREVLSRWRVLVEEPALLGTGRKGTAPIGKVARTRIAKKCRQVLERGYDLSDTTAPDALHALRIECKHLRYLIESFDKFVPEPKRLIRKMKKLQDTLGAIQDLTVQEERLQDYLEGPEIRAESPNTFVAIQELIARVHEERYAEQARVRKLFARFNRSLAKSEPPYGILLPWLRYP